MMTQERKRLFSKETLRNEDKSTNSFKTNPSKLDLELSFNGLVGTNK